MQWGRLEGDPGRKESKSPQPMYWSGGGFLGCWVTGVSQAHLGGYTWHFLWCLPHSAPPWHLVGQVLGSVALFPTPAWLSVVEGRCWPYDCAQALGMYQGATLRCWWLGGSISPSRCQHLLKKEALVVGPRGGGRSSAMEGMGEFQGPSRGEGQKGRSRCRGWLIAQGGCRLEGKVYCFVTIKYPTHSRASSWRSFSKKNRIEEHRFENPALKFQM